MDIFRMRCFVSVAECQSISKAAREQFITQPAMTAQMNALEKELGVQLLDRGRVTTLTPAGEVALKRFRSIVVEYDAARKAVSRAESGACELVRLGFHGPVDWAGVPDMIRAFRDLNPEVEVDIVVDTWNVLIRMLESGTLDLAVVELSELEGRGDIAVNPLFCEGAFLVMPPNHELADRETVSVRDLADRQMMLYDLDAAPRFFSNLYEVFGRAGIKAERCIRGNHYEATIALVLAGGGVTCMPLTFCRGVRGVSLARIDDLDLRMRYGIAWNRSRLTAGASLLASFAQSWSWPAERKKNSLGEFVGDPNLPWRSAEIDDINASALADYAAEEAE